MPSIEVAICPNEFEIIDQLSKLIENRAAECIRRNNSFRVGLSGGSLIKFLCKGLPGITTTWEKWLFFFCDERLVPFDDKESTYGCYKRELIPHLPVTENQFIAVNPSLSVADAADDYVQKLEQHFTSGALPRFDLLLLGVGPDGHTCSLFPGHPLLKEEKKWIAPISDSPKPPPSRITFTLPLLNSAQFIVFVTTGASKAEILKEIFEGNDPPLPAAMVQPTNGEIQWIIDEEAAKLLDRS